MERKREVEFLWILLLGVFLLIGIHHIPQMGQTCRAIRQNTQDPRDD